MTKSKLTAVGACAVLVAALAACAPAAKPTVDTSKIAETVKADFNQLVADFSAKDVDKAVSHDAAGYVGMFHGQPNLVGPAADALVTKQQVSDPNVKLSVTTDAVDVAEAGDMAVVRATYDFGFTDPKTKAPTNEHGNWVLGYKKQADGGWKIAWAVVSDSPAAPPK